MENQTTGSAGINIRALAARVAAEGQHTSEPRGERSTQSGVSPPIGVQFFDGTTDTVGHNKAFESRPALRKHLVNAGPFKSKADCPMFSAGIFDGPIKGRIPTGFILVIGEHDAGTVTVDKAARRLEKAGIAAFFYTSPSHTPEKPRWRVVAPLQAACSAEDYLSYLNLLNGALGGCLAPESADLSRRWFYGRVEGADSPYASVAASRLMHRLMHWARK